MRVDDVDSPTGASTDDGALPAVPVFVRQGDEAEHLAMQIRTLAKRAAKLQAALDNCRLFAARSRNEDWAKTILRYCTDGGSISSPLRFEE